MESTVFVLVGLLAFGYIARIVWKELRGESQCHCAGGCGANCHKQGK